MRKLLFALGCSLAFAGLAAGTEAEYVRDLTELLAIPSVSADKAPCDRAVDWMRGWLEARGVWCTVETWPEDGRKVLYAATREGLKNPDYTIVTHLDVVDAAAEQFVPERKGGRLYARGAGDTKGAAYAAARILERLNGKASVGCVFSSNEEVGGKTTGYLVGLGYGVPKKMVFVFDGGGEPNAISYACKGCAYYKLTAKGKSGHASRPEACDNPIYKLARAALKIEAEYPFQKKGEKRVGAIPHIIESMLMPMTIADAKDIFENNGLLTASVLAPISYFGGRVASYDDEYNRTVKAGKGKLSKFKELANGNPSNGVLPDVESAKDYFEKNKSSVSAANYIAENTNYNTDISKLERSIKQYRNLGMNEHADKLQEILNKIMDSSVETYRGLKKKGK